jgi:hypothetical protein
MILHTKMVVVNTKWEMCCLVVRPSEVAATVLFSMHTGG